MAAARSWAGPGRRVVLAVGAAALVVAGCSSDGSLADPPAAADDVDEAAADDVGADTSSDDDAAATDGSEEDGSGGGGYGLVDEVCATFDHDHFDEVHGIASVVADDEVTSLGGHTDYLYCELDAGNHTGPDGQTLTVAIFFHPSGDIARGEFEQHPEGQATAVERPGPWEAAVLTSTAVTSEGRFSVELFVLDGSLEVWVEARTLEPFTVDVWAEPLEQIALEVLASLRAG